MKLLSGINTCAVLRTSSSIPKALSGIRDIPLLSGKDVIKNKDQGIFIVGSHVKKTTLQLQSLLKFPRMQGMELDVNEILSFPEKLLHKTLRFVNNIHSKDMTPVVYTSRKELRSGNHTKRMQTGNSVSAFLVNIVKNMTYTPSYIVAKGGITSHDILKDGLNIEYARVMGQLLDGVPVIMTGKKSKFPNMPIIIFPGNVGNERSLNEVFEKLDSQNH